MAFSGVRHTKKILKEVDKAIVQLQAGRKLLEYCNDTTGNMCDGRPDEVDGSKEEAESEALDTVYDAVKILYKPLLDNGYQLQD
jgi:hypothetical protein